MRFWEITVDPKLSKKSKLYPTILEGISKAVLASLKEDWKYHYGKNYQTHIAFGGTVYFVIYEIKQVDKGDILNIKEVR